MTHSMEPSGYLSERSSASATWHWRLFDPAGSEITEEQAGRGPRFTSQGDAETWLGETWRDLAEAGVESVRLMDADREVYGPMSLNP